MADVLESFNVRQKYSHFRILVIGRANAGKTTLLKRVCNTTDDPRIYNEGMNLVRFSSGAQRGIALTSHGKPAGANLSGDLFV
jgi:GTP-binding protein EngB required for normal cell division